MAATNPSHPVSVAIAAEAPRYLAVIEHVLALDYLAPDLRRRVVRMQHQLMQADIGVRQSLGEAIPEPI